jgi:maltose/moltooligosaccharide transporter
MKLDYKKTFLIAFGFFATSLAWSIYNSTVPMIIESRYVHSTAVIGLIMTIDNVFGVIFQPLFGQLSDRTHTRFGRRMPYIMAGIPICATAFIFIPRTKTLAAMMTVIIIFNLVMSFWRSPVVALMPDLTPSALRSKANGVINMMGGIGTIIAFLVGGILIKIGGYNVPYLMGALIMIFALIMMVRYIREPQTPVIGQAEDSVELELDPDKAKHRVNKNIKISKVWQPGEKRSLFALLLAIFFWFCGYNAIEAFFTLYATKKMGLSPGDATMTLALLSLTLVGFAIPAGILAGRMGRRRMIIVGLIGMIAIFMSLALVSNLWTLRVMLLLSGIFWSCININSLPMVVEMATSDRIGSFTGYYYFFSFSAAIFSPILFGKIRDMTQNYGVLFVYASATFALALVSMMFVRHGETQTQVSLGNALEAIND